VLWRACILGSARPSIFDDYSGQVTKLGQLYADLAKVDPKAHIGAMVEDRLHAANMEYATVANRKTYAQF